MSNAERLVTLERETTRKLGKRDAILELIDREETRAEEREEEAAKISKAVEVLQTATETRRQELKDRVESLVTKGLRAVFNRDDFEFAFHVQLRRDKFGVVPVLRSKFGDREIETGVVEGHGGGVNNVVAFILRVVVMSLARPKVAPILILDESFSMVSTDRLRGVASLLRELNQSAGIQFVMITHKEELLDAADVIYRAKLTEGRTEFSLEHATRDESYHARPKRGQKRSDRTTLFDDEDMTKPVQNPESVESETTDVLARRQRKQAEIKKRPKKRKSKERPSK